MIALTDNEFIPYGRQSIDEDDVQAVADVLRGDWLTTGPYVHEFEEALSRVVGAQAVAVSSGTAALHCAYSAAGLGVGDEVITSPITFVATAAAAVHLGAKVQFADVSDDTLNLDPEAAAAIWSPAVRAVTAVDFAGHPADLKGLMGLARSQNALLIEDASHSLGASYRSRPVGSIADLTTFSFHPVKTITTGEGGAVASLDGHLVELARRFRNHGLVRDPSQLWNPDEGGWHQEVQNFGLNYRLSDILAALGTSQLKKLDRFIERRRKLVARYRQLLQDVEGLRLPGQREDVEPVWHLFYVRILDGRRKAVFKLLRERAIGVQVHYLPVHHHPAFQDLGYKRGSCPIAETAYEELVSLPLHPGLTEEQQDRVVDELVEALGQ